MNLYVINICGIKFVYFNIHSEFMFIQHGNLTNCYYVCRTSSLLMEAVKNLVVFLIAKGGIQFCLHEFLQNVFETVPEQGIDIGDAV